MTRFISYTLTYKVMKRRIFLLISILSMLVPSATSETVNSGDEVVTCDMDKTIPTLFDDWIEDISCTVLEKDLFDTYMTIIPYKDLYYVMGRTIAGVKIVIFKDTGEYVKELQLQDPIATESMTIIPELEELWVISFGNIIHKYKLDGTFLKRIKLPFSCTNIITADFPDFLVYSGGGKDEKGSIQQHLFALTDFQTIHQLFIPQWGTQTNPYAPFSLYAKDTNTKRIYVFPSKIDTIYCYSYLQKKMKPYYALNFHGDFLTKDKEPAGPSENKEMNDIITQNKYIYTHTSFQLVNNKLVFKLRGKRDDFYMIDLNSNKAYSFDKLFDQFQTYSYNPFLGAKDNSLYMIVREQDLNKHYQSHTCSYDKLKQRLKALPATSNKWILLKINLK